MSWWAWLILGVVLFGAELFAIDAQFFLVFLGVSAALVGLAEMAGLVMPEWAQWLTFAALSLISMFTFRKSLYGKIRGNVPGFKEGVTGDYVVVSKSLEPGERGRTSFRGADWTIVNDGSDRISDGTRAKIVRSEGLTLFVSTDSD
jgi:membrane protein implicated in regulation of membrane protease activity